MTLRKCPNCGKEFTLEGSSNICPHCYTRLAGSYRPTVNIGSSVDYRCSKCGSAVDKGATVCPHCHARLGGIRCQSCGFTGSTADFANDRCPQCSTVIQPSQAYENFQKNPDKEMAKACIWGAVIIVGAFLLIALFAAMQ